MKLKSFLSILIITAFLIFIYRLYYIYNLFYSNYFDPTSYERYVWIGRDKMPTKIEIFFWGFTDLKTIGITFVISSVLYFFYKKLEQNNHSQKVSCQADKSTHNMTYRLTPLNIVCGLATGLVIYSAIKHGPESWVFLITIYFAPVIIIGLLVDFMLQKFLTKYLPTFLIELLLLTAIYFAYFWT